MEVVRLVEEAVLKTVGCNSFGGSIPSASANEHVAKLVRQRSTNPLIAGSIPAMFSDGNASTLES